MSARPSPPRFDPHAHREALEPLVAAVAREAVLDARALDRLVKRHPKRPGGLFSKSEIIAGFRAFGAGRAADAGAGGAAVDEASFLARLRLRPVRTLSGVTPVTVLTKPFPCPGTCVFCPSDVRMPKSYLADEPGAQRAEDHRFDPYRQTWSRLDAYRAIGHPVDKVELIVLGGTWSAYPEAYRRWFTTRCFDALNDFGRGVDRRAKAAQDGAGSRHRVDDVDYRALAPIDGRGARTYNDVLGPVSRLRSGTGGTGGATWARLEAAQRANQAARCRCVGLSFETRPDHVSEREVLHLRRLGATKVQLGIQSLSDARLAASRRGHDVAATRRAVRLLRAAGFKLQAHWMPNLPGATPADDLEDFARLFDDPDVRPDELKLYPCLLVESAPLVAHYERGDWKPYDDATLTELLAGCIARTPRWCRLTRVVRDFSAGDVLAGTHVANLREVAERRLEERAARGAAEPARDIRAREIRDTAFDPGALRLLATPYATSSGREVFLELATPEPEERLVAFLRLSLPRGSSFVEELSDGRGPSAVIREVHVYGASLPLGARGAAARPAAQHGGLGRRLVGEAARRARDAGFARLAVISAVGTRAWYRGLGFRDGVLYQHLDLS